MIQTVSKKILSLRKYLLKIIFLGSFMFLHFQLKGDDLNIEGLNIIYNNDYIVGNAIYNIDDTKVFFISKESLFDKYESDKVYQYNFTDKSLKVVFDPLKGLPTKNGAIKAKVSDLYLYNENLIVISSLKDSDKKILNLHTIATTNHSIISMELLDKNEKRLYGEQSTTNKKFLYSNRADSFKRLSLSSNEVEVFNYEDLNLNKNKIRYSICGYDSDEIYILYDLEDQLSLGIYSISEKILKDEIILPKAITDKVLLNSFSKILISPDGKYLLLNHFAYGVWLFDLDKRIHKDLILVEKRSPDNDIHLLDWSIKTKKILLLIGNSIFELDLNVFQENHIDGVRLK